jgi:hypothetical protein
LRGIADFADYVNGSALTQWSFVVPNVVNDDYDTSIDHTAQCLQHQLFPLFGNELFNNILIVLSFDKNESYAEIIVWWCRS